MTNTGQRFIVVGIAVIQVATSFVLLLASGEAESVAKQSVGHGTHADFQLSVPFILLVSALPVIASVILLARRAPLDVVLTALFALFLVVVLLASLQVFGAWRLWYENQLPTTAANFGLQPTRSAAFLPSKL